MKIYDLDEEQRAWIASRPESVKKLIGQLPPDRLYLIKETGQRGYIYSYNEGGTVTLVLDWTFNDHLSFERQVFGLSPEAIVECEPLCGPLRPPRFTDPAAIRAYCALLRKA